MDRGLLHGLVNPVVHIIVAADSCPILFSIASGDHLSDEKKYSHLYHHYFLIILTCVSTRYLDQLGQSAKYDTKVYCRQTLIGGNYGLLDTDTFVPNPDYYRQVCVPNMSLQT